MPITAPSDRPPAASGRLRWPLSRGAAGNSVAALLSASQTGPVVNPHPLAAGVHSPDSFSHPNQPSLSIVSLPDGGITEVVLDAEGASNNLFGGSVQWSPDGTQFAYTATGLDTGLYEVRVCNRDGSNIRTILRSTDPNTGVADQWAVYDWWPDGSALLISWCDFNSVAGRIMKCAPDGSNLQTLYDDPIGQHIGQANNNYLALSPDGSAIVAACSDSPHSPAPATWVLRTMHASGGPLSLLYSDPIFYPTLELGCMGWRPGSKIAFMTPGGQETRIYTINADGSDLQLISEGPWFSAVWINDTQLLVVPNNGGTPLVVMELDGTHTTIPSPPSTLWGGVKMSVLPAAAMGKLAPGVAARGAIRIG